LQMRSLWRGSDAIKLAGRTGTPHKVYLEYWKDRLVCASLPVNPIYEHGITRCTHKAWGLPLTAVTPLSSTQLWKFIPTGNSINLNFNRNLC
jgi:hypothetical protein